MQPIVSTNNSNMDVKTVYENDIFNDKDFHVVIYNKTESATGLHQHDYYEYTIVLTGRYYQNVNGRKVLLERGEFFFTYWVKP